MNNTKNISSKEAIDKLKSLVNDINICLFCTNLKTDIGATARPMSAVKVCDQGNIWFFSEKNSDKNQAIVQYWKAVSTLWKLLKDNQFILKINWFAKNALIKVLIFSKEEVYVYFKW